MKDIMIDLETLGTRSSAAIIQIGACYFDRNTGNIGNTFEVNIDEFDDKFTMDMSTIAWWLKQSDQARASVTEEGAPMITAMLKLKDFLQGGDCLWAHATFDIPIIQHAFEVFGLKNPIPFRGMRDIRTLMDIADHKSEKPREGVHHTALDDALFQVQYCVEALNKLKQ